MTRVAVLYSGGRDWGGIETYLLNLLRLYDRQKMKLLLISLGGWELTRTLASQGLSSETRVLSGKRIRLRTVLDLTRTLRKERVGLLVSQGTVANAYARLAALFTGVPNLTVVHSDIILDYPQAVTRWAYLLADRTLRPVTKQYVAVSHYLEDRLVRSGVEAGRVRVVYNGVGTDAGEQKAPLRPRGRPDVSLASVGRLHPVKNYDALIASMRLLPDPVRLTIWGDGRERTALEALVADLGLKERVRLPGESQNMQQALDDVDIYLQPSRSEGCSFAVAEAMLQGKPVVVTPCGGLPEQVEDGVTGLVAKDCSPQGLADTIATLVRDRELALRLGQAGREAAREMYDMRKWLARTTTAFCEAAGEDADERLSDVRPR